MRLLELFSGTGSVGKVAKELDYEIVSLDINDYKGKFIPTHKEDIMTWDYKQYDKDYFDVLWASPPCIYYSTLQFAWRGRKKKDGIFTIEKHENLMKLADSWVKKAIEIIDYFNPDKWFIENPQSGALKNREFMKEIPFVDVDYCMYSDWGYKKPTRIWTNMKMKGKRCDMKNNCGNMVKWEDKTCKYQRPNRPVKKTRKGLFHRVDASKDINKLNRYRIPPKLILELLTC